MGIRRIVLVSYFAFILISACALAQDGNSTGVPPQTHEPAANQLNVPVPGPTSFDQVLDKVVEREHFFTAQMHHLHPLVETYIQNLKGDKELGMVPASDQYALALSYAELVELYQAADAYVAPYHAEGFNLPVLEAHVQAITADAG